MKVSNTFLKLAALLCLLAVRLSAVDPNRAMSQYIRDQWGREQGFPQGPVYSISQTEDGYLWIGTESGLLRFDGWNFRPVSSPYNVVSVLGLIPDKDNSLWVRRQGPRVLRYHDQTLDDPLLGLQSSNITAMARLRSGELVAYGLNHGTVVYRDGKLQTLIPAHVLPRSPVISMAQTSDGDFWLGTRDVGLFRFSNGQISSIDRGLPDTKINCLFAGENRDLWVGTDKGVVYWNGSELSPVPLGKPFSRLQSLAMLRDHDGNLWVGTDSRGLLRVNQKGVSPLDPLDRDAPEAVTALFEDREGNLWIGRSDRLERLRDSAFVSYSHSEGIQSDGANPIFADSSQRLWFAPAAGGLAWIEDGQHGSVQNLGLQDDVIYSISGKPGELWLGRQKGGLTQLVYQQGISRAKTYTVADGLAKSSIYAVDLARDGTVWAGSLSGGLTRLRNGIVTTFTVRDGLPSNSITSVIESSDNSIWIATPAGIASYSNNQWKPFPSGLPSPSVNCLLQDSKGLIWAGTSLGLAFRDGDGFQPVKSALPILREPILGMADDRLGFLWVATSDHLLRLDRDRLIQGQLTAEHVREYGLADGLRGTEGIRRHSSVVTDSQGRIWFSMNRGISVVDPRRLNNITVPALPHLQSLIADGTLVDLQNTVRIPSGHQRFTFAYAGLSLAVPSRVRFRYRLDGFDRDWSPAVSAREANYTNLGPGPYRFRLVASNADGLWNGPEEVLSFEIEPAFWQAGWFRIGLVTVLALLALSLYLYRMHNLTRQLNMRFEERLSERTRVAQELHDTLLQGFLSASMQLHVAADRLPEDSPAKPKLDHVQKLMSHVIEEGRNAVRGLRSPDLGPHDLGQTFSRIQQELGIGSEMQFRVVIEGEPRPLQSIIRDEVYRICREALLNAFRHSRASNLEIEMDYAPKKFRCSIRDNGCGIDSQILLAGREGHFGLLGMRERAQLIGGQLQIYSSSSAGTEVVLSLPGHIAYPPQARNARWQWLSRFSPRKSNPPST